VPRIEVAGGICLRRPRTTQGCTVDDDDDDDDDIFSTWEAFSVHHKSSV
jgi:hypothetical protein